MRSREKYPPILQKSHRFSNVSRPRARAECQCVIMPNTLRHKKFQVISRFLTCGRNFGLSYVLSTQRLASVDVSAVELCGLRYWGKLEGERNLRKSRFWLSKFETWNLKNLKIGQFYVQVAAKIKLFQFPEYKKEEVKVVV